MKREVNVDKLMDVARGNLLEWERTEQKIVSDLDALVVQVPRKTYLPPICHLSATYITRIRQAPPKTSKKPSPEELTALKEHAQKEKAYLASLSGDPREVEFAKARSGKLKKQHRK